MNARSALFDLYGDHLRARGGRASVGSLIQLLGALDVTPPAVRTAVSRMVRQGWLTALRRQGRTDYLLTDRATRRLDEAAVRIYGRAERPPWDGRWSMIVVSHVTDRTRRERLQRALGYLGYRPLQPQTWLAPQPSVEVEAVLGTERTAYDEFTVRFGGEDHALVDRLYDLDALAAAYLAWIGEAEQIVAVAGPTPENRAAFAARSRLVHEWRKFLFRDPGLPPELLPDGWPGSHARAYFTAEADRLAAGAAAYVDCCLQPGRTE